MACSFRIALSVLAGALLGTAFASNLPLSRSAILTYGWGPGNMITVQFLRSGDKPLRTVGPFPWVRVDGKSLHAGPNGEEVARYHGGVWYATELSTPKYVVHGSTCTVRCEQQGSEDSTVLGPLDKVEVVDGAAYTQPGHRLIARLDEEKQAWYTYEDKRFWSSLVIEHCAGAEDS